MEAILTSLCIVWLFVASAITTTQQKKPIDHAKMSDYEKLPKRHPTRR